MFVDRWRRLFKSGNEDVLLQTVQVRFYLELDFETKVQVAYKNSDEQLKLSRFYGNSWSADLRYKEGIPEVLTFKVFVYTPNLTEKKLLKLGLDINEKQVQMEEFVLSPENDFAGWFSIQHTVEHLE